MKFLYINTPTEEVAMKEEITTVFCISDELHKAMGIHEDPQVKMNNAEVMTTALTASLFFSGNYEKSRIFLSEHGYIANMLSRSQFNRRLHAIPETVWLALFGLLAELHKRANPDNEYAMDSFPVPVCDNIRISRSRIYKGEEYRGYIPSKRRYFYGLRIHIVVTKTGEPVEFTLAPGATNDCRVLKQFDLDLPSGSTIYADKSYNDYGYEDLLKEAADISLSPLRKKNSKRAVECWSTFLRKYFRKRVETTASQINDLFPKSIHAVTSKGFELKLVLFVIAFSIKCL
jgi:hypothetical protein